MKELRFTPKIITFITSIYNIILMFTYLYLISRFYNTYQELELQLEPLLYWSLLVPLTLTIGSFVYWFYLRKKEKRGEKVKFALLISIVLFLISVFVVPQLIFFQLINPLYKLSVI